MCIATVEFAMSSVLVLSLSVFTDFTIVLCIPYY